MKQMKNCSYFVILTGMLLALCCISSVAYSSSDDEPEFGVEPWFKDNIAFQGLDSVPRYGGSINWEEIDTEANLMSLPERPRQNGVPPIEVDYNPFSPDYINSLISGSNSYGTAPSSDITSFSMKGPIVATPEPTTISLFAIGAFALRKRKNP